MPGLMVFCVVLAMASPGRAHEFWLEPSDFAPKPGAKVAIRIKNGMLFKGDSYPLVRSWFKRFVVVDGAAAQAIKGTEGDDPAVQIAFKSPGIAILAYHSTADSLEFETWEKFTSYLKDEGLQAIEAQHLKRGLRKTGIKELYVRCAKTLIGVGAGKGVDRSLGMPLELVALKNPYELPAGAPLPVRLTYLGKPIAGLTIKIFNMADPGQPQRVITGNDGAAMIPLPHKGAYLLNAVHIYEPEKAKDAPDWRSLWASLTFERR